MTDERREEYRKIFELLEKVRADMADLSADEKEIREELQAMMKEDEADKLESEKLEAIISFRKNSTFDLPRFLDTVPAEKVAAAAKSLDFGKLIEAGVDPQLIEDCKIEKEATQVFTIRERKPKRDKRKVTDVS